MQLSGNSTQLQILCVAVLSICTHFLEASIEDMLPMAYVEAHTTKFYFCKLLLTVSFLACQETFEKDTTERLYLRKRVSNKRHISIWDADWLAAFAFSVPASYHQAANTWPKPKIRLGSLLAQCSGRRTRKLLLECKASRAQLRCK
jgi:hypothetical protein